MTICQTVSVHESKPWAGDHYDESAPTTYRVSCPAHQKVYEGQSSENALSLRDEHRECVTPLRDHIAFAFTTVATRTEVFATYMSQDELRRSYGGRKTRIFVDIDESDISMPRPPYGSQRGDGSPEDADWRKYNRLELGAMKLRFSRVRSTLEMFFGLAPGSKLGFSRKAGCGMCPCSPGFILQGQVRYNQARHGADFSTPVDLHVSKAFGAR